MARGWENKTGSEAIVVGESNSFRTKTLQTDTTTGEKANEESWETNKQVEAVWRSRKQSCKAKHEKRHHPCRDERQGKHENAAGRIVCCPAAATRVRRLQNCPSSSPKTAPRGRLGLPRRDVARIFERKHENAAGRIVCCPAAATRVSRLQNCPSSSPKTAPRGRLGLPRRDVARIFERDHVAASVTRALQGLSQITTANATQASSNA